MKSDEQRLKEVLMIVDGNKKRKKRDSGISLPIPSTQTVPERTALSSRRIDLTAP